MDETSVNQRRSLIHLIRSGKKPAEAAEELERSRAWAYKWWQRYWEKGWEGLAGWRSLPYQQGHTGVL